MKINNKWIDETAWTFHIDDKNLIRDAIADDSCKKLKILSGLVVKPEWMKCDGEVEPPNVQFMRDLRAAYLEWVKTQEVPAFESAFLEKAIDFIVTLFKQDSAYFERIGGIVTFFIYNRFRWVDKSKEERLQLLKEAKMWWSMEDERERTKTWINNIWNCVIRGYENREFWTKSIDFTIDYFIENNGKWVIVEMYDPKKWFPRGRGQVNNLIHGGEA